MPSCPHHTTDCPLHTHSHALDWRDWYTAFGCNTPMKHRHMMIAIRHNVCFTQYRSYGRASHASHVVCRETARVRRHFVTGCFSSNQEPGASFIAATYMRAVVKPTPLSPKPSTAYLGVVVQCVLALITAHAAHLQASPSS